MSQMNSILSQEAKRLADIERRKRDALVTNRQRQVMTGEQTPDDVSRLLASDAVYDPGYSAIRSRDALAVRQAQGVPELSQQLSGLLPAMGRGPAEDQRSVNRLRNTEAQMTGVSAGLPATTRLDTRGLVDMTNPLVQQQISEGQSIRQRQDAIAQSIVAGETRKNRAVPIEVETEEIKSRAENLKAQNSLAAELAKAEAIKSTGMASAESNTKVGEAQAGAARYSADRGLEGDKLVAANDAIRAQNEAAVLRQGVEQQTAQIAQEGRQTFGTSTAPGMAGIFNRLTRRSGYEQFKGDTGLANPISSVLGMVFGQELSTNSAGINENIPLVIQGIASSPNPAREIEYAVGQLEAARQIIMGDGQYSPAEQNARLAIIDSLVTQIRSIPAQ